MNFPALPPGLTAADIESLEQETSARETLLRRIVQGFEKKYGCSLEEFERRIEARQVPEHPSWEDSIEWRNAVEQLERIKVSRSIFAWIQSLLAQSSAS